MRKHGIYLAQRLTPSEVHKFERVATDVLGERSRRSSSCQLRQRYMANVYGKVLSRSGTLRDGNSEEPWP